MARYYGDCVYGLELYKGVPETPEGTTELFSYEPNWDASIQMRYRFNTRIATARLLQEQRKPLLDKPMRTEKFSILDERPVFNTKMINYLKKNHAKQMLVPLFTEPCMVDTSRHSQSLQNETFIYIDQTDLTYTRYFNLWNYTSMVILIDFSETIKSELKWINYLGPLGIQFGSGVNANFQRGTTVIYPIFEAILKAKDISDPTDEVTIFNLSFEEVFLYGI